MQEISNSKMSRSEPAARKSRSPIRRASGSRRNQSEHRLAPRLARFLILLVAGGFFSLVLPSRGATPLADRIQRTLDRLKEIPEGGGTQGQVINLTNYLVRQNPRAMTSYYRTGLDKLPESDFDSAIEAFTNSVVEVYERHAQRVGISIQVIRKQIKRVHKIEESHKPPEPTPTPYQAFVPASLRVLPAETS